uniref:Uncharacterized protein n=1 Tax=Ascaris lumbricoides TaxID=6252 RepID=A0A9J2PR07_ASCLU
LKLNKITELFRRDEHQKCGANFAILRNGCLSNVIHVQHSICDAFTVMKTALLHVFALAVLLLQSTTAAKSIDRHVINNLSARFKRQWGLGYNYGGGWGTGYYNEFGYGNGLNIGALTVKDLKNASYHSLLNKQRILHHILMQSV